MTATNTFMTNLVLAEILLMVILMFVGLFAAARGKRKVEFGAAFGFGIMLVANWLTLIIWWVI